MHAYSIVVPLATNLGSMPVYILIHKQMHAYSIVVPLATNLGSMLVYILIYKRMHDYSIVVPLATNLGSRLETRKKKQHCRASHGEPHKKGATSTPRWVHSLRTMSKWSKIARWSERSTWRSMNLARLFLSLLDRGHSQESLSGGKGQPSCSSFGIAGLPVCGNDK